MSELEQAKARIAKLLNMTTERGASENEAMTAAEKAGDLMAFYDIEIGEIGLGDRSCIKTSSTQLRFGPWHIASYISMAIAKFCDCRVWTVRDSLTDPKQHVYFGLPQDAEFASYLMDMLSNTVLMECQAYTKSDEYRADPGNANSKKRSFMIGMENRIRDRLYDLSEKKQETVKATTGTSLIVLKEVKVEEEFADLGLKLTPHRRRQPVANSDNAYYAGREAGDKVNITRGVGDKSKGAIGHG